MTKPSGGVLKPSIISVQGYVWDVSGVTLLESLNLEFRSDENLILFHAEEFRAIYYGESGYETLPNGVRSTAKKQGLLFNHFYPTKQRLTMKAIDIMRKHELIQGIGSDIDGSQT